MTNRPGRLALLLFYLVCATHASGAADDDFVRVRAPRIALVHVRVIDGTGSAAAGDQSLVIEQGRIVAFGPSAKTIVPADSQLLDLPGYTVIPGLVGMHDHLFYAVPPGEEYVSASHTFPRLYLASGVTTIRTAGAIDLQADVAAKRAIDAGREPGPAIHLTSPYFGDAGGSPGADRIRATVEALAKSGVTWFKAYTALTRDDLAALVEAAHAKGLKVTGHLCAVGFREAAQLGIDNLEHGLVTDTEFYSRKIPDQCPENWANVSGLVQMDVDDPRLRDLITELVARHVAITSTPAVFESFAGRSSAVDVRLRDVLAPEARAKWEKTSLWVAETGAAAHSGNRC